MLIQTQNLTKIYTTGETEVRALDDVSLSISRGEFVSVVGTSGSGKSTLLHLLGGLDLPTNGKVFIDGTDICRLASDPLTVFRRRCIGFPLIAVIINTAMDALVTLHWQSGIMMLTVCIAVSVLSGLAVFRLTKSAAVVERIKVE